MPRTEAMALCLVMVAGPGASTTGAADGLKILRKIDDLWRGKSSAALMSMRIKTAHWERSLRMKGYSKGKDLSLVRIVRPKQEAGTATLKVEDNIWNYLPKTRRVMKIPASMMMGSWMGSHFTNDDLVRESRLEEDYTFELAERRTADGQAVYEITLMPRPEAPVVWGKVVLEVQKDTLIPNREDFYDEEGKLVRKLVFENLQTVGNRRLPMTLRMLPVDKPDEFTEFSYEQLKFDVPLPDSFFSLQNLKRR